MSKIFGQRTMGANFTNLQKQKIINEISKLGIDDINVKNLVKKFISEIKAGISGKKASLELHPSFIKYTGKITNQAKCAILQFGQVNLAKGYYESDGEKTEVYGIMKYPMPGLHKSMSISEFFKKVIFYARDVLRGTNEIGLCMKHPIKPRIDGDATLINWARNAVCVPDLVGKHIAEEFNKYLEIEFGRRKKIVVLNDTVATLISGVAKTCEKEYEDFIGVIHSDGFNISYIEEVSKLKKIIKEGNLKKGNVVMDIEAGSFDKIKETKIDMGVMEKLDKVKVGAFSRKVNTKCFILALKYIVQEVSEDIISSDVKDKFVKNDDVDIEEVYSFFSGGLRSNSIIGQMFKKATLIEAGNLGLIIDKLIERIAKLVSVQICGLLEYKDIGHNPLQPVGVVVDGEIFEVVREFEYRVRCEISKYFGIKDPRYVKFLYIPNATLIGAGIAATI